MPLISVS